MKIFFIQFFKDSYNDLYKWSIDNYVKFWEEFWHFSKIIHSKSYTCVLEKESGPVDNFPFKWFDGVLLNYAENLLKYNDERVAVYSFGNSKFCNYLFFVYKFNFFCYLGEAFTQIKSTTFKNLRERVRLYQNALKNLKIQKGDCVAGWFKLFLKIEIFIVENLSLKTKKGYLPNSIESLEAKLATISMGAIWSCVSPDFGPNVIKYKN